MMLSLIHESFKAEGNVLFSNFLVSGSADTKVKMYKSLLAWGRGLRAVHQLSGEASPGKRRCRNTGSSGEAKDAAL